MRVSHIFFILFKIEILSKTWSVHDPVIDCDVNASIIQKLQPLFEIQLNYIRYKFRL